MTLEKAEHVVFLTAVEDPWREVTKTTNNSANATQIAYFQDCTDCAHCVDLHTPNSTTDPVELTQARLYASNTIKGWLTQELAAREEKKGFIQ